MSHEHLFDELKRYVDFGDEDEARLRGLHPVVTPHAAAIADDFSAHILAHPDAADVIKGGPDQIARLKDTLVRWLEELLSGPWDEAYFQRRARIGRRHVQVNLRQHYMFTAMNLIRGHLKRLATDAPAVDEAATLPAIDKIVDLELAIMLRTYREDVIARMLRSERLAAYGQLAASIAHELRNPLGVMDTSLYLLGRKLAEDDAGMAQVERLRGQVELSKQIITNLLDLVRDQRPTLHPTPAASVVSAAVDTTPPERRAQVRLEIDDTMPALHVDPLHITRVLANLLSNAFEAAGEEGHVELAVRRDGAEALITVCDDGPGIDPAIRDRIFEALITTKAHGIGLGLALCHRLVTENGGTIRLGEGPLPGACFEVRVPLEG